VGKKMGWSDRKTLHAYHNSIKYQYCIMCGKCSSTCSTNINITTINRALMYCEGYRDFELGRQTYLELSTRENGLSCMSCSSPTCQCVNNIKIAYGIVHLFACIFCVQFQAKIITAYQQLKSRNYQHFVV